MAILTFKAARGLNNRQTATAFGVTEQTIANWMTSLNAEGPANLVQIASPVNKYPDFLKFGVQQLKRIVPLLGKKTIAEYLVRAGLNISATTVGRYVKAPTVPPDPALPSEPKRIISRRPDHIWLVDLTTVPTCSGFWSAWFPFALPQVWPFCYWVGVVIDHFSSRVAGFALFRRPPSSRQVTDVIDKAIIRVGRKPKHIISDKGPQFYPVRAKHRNRKNHPYIRWCSRRQIRPRFGAIGRYGSIAIIERFMRTLKTECTRRIIVPFDFDVMRREIAIYVTWYNEYRPHQSHGARTPQEVHDHSPPVERQQFKRNCDLPETRIEVAYFEGR